jgi:hypothetical protein
MRKTEEEEGSVKHLKERDTVEDLDTQTGKIKSE